MAKKWTVQDELADLRAKLGQSTHELRDARMRAATIAEEKQKVEEHLSYMKAQLEQMYEDRLRTDLYAKECRNAAEFYHRQADRMLREIVYRGKKREKHDLEYAVVRSLIQSNNELSAENLRKMAESTPGVDLRKLIFVAAEFSSAEDETNKNAEAKPLAVKIWWTKDGWKS